MSQQSGENINNHLAKHILHVMLVWHLVLECIGTVPYSMTLPIAERNVPRHSHRNCVHEAGASIAKPSMYVLLSCHASCVIAYSYTDSDAIFVHILRLRRP